MAMPWTHLLPEGITKVMLRPPPSSSGGKPISVNRMMAAVLHHSPFEGIILGVVH
jgi:hypothetical protein